MRKNVKGFIVIALIVLAGGAVLFGPLLNKDETPAEARFDFLGDVATVADLESTIKIKLVGEEGLAKVELLLDSRVIKSWSKPTSNLEFKFAPKNIGTFTFQVVSTDSDGLMKVDERRLKVVSNITPEALTAKIVKGILHDITSYYQGWSFTRGACLKGQARGDNQKFLRLTWKESRWEYN